LGREVKAPYERPDAATGPRRAEETRNDAGRRPKAQHRRT